jgi:Co/Zn/Cd efflux system component
VVNAGCALLLARYRQHGGSLKHAAFLSARNDAFANIGIIGTTTARKIADSNLLACKWNRRFRAGISECVGNYQQD